MTDKMNKPPWSTAPDWAEWLAQDADGDIVAFKFKPEPKAQYLNGHWDAEGRTRRISRGQPNPNWRKTLERRPESTAAEIGRAMDEACKALRGIGITERVVTAKAPPDLLIPAEFDDKLGSLAIIAAKASRAGYRIEWDSTGLRGWKGGEDECL